MVALLQERVTTLTTELGRESAAHQSTIAAVAASQAEAVNAAVLQHSRESDSECASLQNKLAEKLALLAQLEVKISTAETAVAKETASRMKEQAERKVAEAELKTKCDLMEAETSAKLAQHAGVHRSDQSILVAQLEESKQKCAAAEARALQVDTLSAALKHEQKQQAASAITQSITDQDNLAARAQLEAQLLSATAETSKYIVQLAEAQRSKTLAVAEAENNAATLALLTVKMNSLESQLGSAETVRASAIQAVEARLNTTIATLTADLNQSVAATAAATSVAEKLDTDAEAADAELERAAEIHAVEVARLQAAVDAASAETAIAEDEVGKLTRELFAVKVDAAGAAATAAAAAEEMARQLLAAQAETKETGGVKEEMAATVAAAVAAATAATTMDGAAAATRAADLQTRLEAEIEQLRAEAFQASTEIERLVAHAQQMRIESSDQLAVEEARAVAATAAALEERANMHDELAAQLTAGFEAARAEQTTDYNAEREKLRAKVAANDATVAALQEIVAEIEADQSADDNISEITSLRDAIVVRDAAASELTEALAQAKQELTAASATHTELMLAASAAQETQADLIRAQAGQAAAEAQAHTQAHEHAAVASTSLSSLEAEEKLTAVGAELAAANETHAIKVTELSTAAAAAAADATTAKEQLAATVKAAAIELAAAREAHSAEVSAYEAFAAEVAATKAAHAVELQQVQVAAKSEAEGAVAAAAAAFKHDASAKVDAVAQLKAQMADGDAAMHTLLEELDQAKKLLAARAESTAILSAAIADLKQKNTSHEAEHQQNAAEAVELKQRLVDLEAERQQLKAALDRVTLNDMGPVQRKAGARRTTTTPSPIMPGGASTRGGASPRPPRSKIASPQLNKRASTVSTGGRPPQAGLTGAKSETTKTTRPLFRPQPTSNGSAGAGAGAGGMLGLSVSGSSVEK
jgi:hypothetical protein